MKYHVLFSTSEFSILKLRIRHKVVFAIVGINILLTLSLFLLNSWSFRRGFSDYVQQVEEAKLIPMIEELATLYESRGNWEWIHTEHYRWSRLMNKYVITGKPGSKGRPPPPPPLSHGAAGSRPPPPHNGRPPGFRPPPDFHRPPGDMSSGSKPPRPGAFPPPSLLVPIKGLGSKPPRPGAFPPRNPRRPPAGSTAFSFNNALFLADERKKMVLGNPEIFNKAHWKPILLNKKTVGYLGLIPKERLTDQLDQIFSRQQYRNYAWASLGLVLLSIITALLLAARMIKPICLLDKGAKKLIAGDYQHQLNYKSGDELGDLANNFNLLANTLQKSLNARQQWIADISHELRTPVAILQAEIEAILDGVRSATPESLASLHTETKQLSRLIADLNELTLSDLGALSYKMENIDIQEIIDDVVETKANALEAGQIKIEFEVKPEPFTIVGDYQRLTQLFTNLMQNSLRYTDAPGTLRIEVEKVADNILISWADSKPGVSSEQLALIFDRLYRVESSRNRKTGGSGLGLAISENIVEAHQGSMIADHSELGGLRIQVTLPLFPLHPIHSLHHSQEGT
ncbi:MAG: ATP-binding protein [Thiotrichaceae bacterium]